MKLAYTLLLITAILLIQCLIGGTRLVFCLPSYGIVAVAAVLSVFSIRRPIAKPNLLCLGGTALFFAYILARAATSPVAYLAWMDFYMVLACLAVYLLTALYITRTRLRTTVIVALLALAIVEVLIGLRQFKGEDNWMPFGFIRSDYGGRASGTFISSITLAGYLEAVGVFALSLAIWTTWKGWARSGLAYVSLLCYVGVAVTGSRGGYLSSAASLAALAVITLWIKRHADPRRFASAAVLSVVLLALGIGGAVIAMQKSSLLRQRLELIGKPDVRYYNWLAALDQFKVSPWVGTGAGTHLYYGRFFRRPPLQSDPEHAHSDYLELLAEYGLVGAVGMAVFLFLHLQNSLTAVGAMIKSSEHDPHLPFRDDRLAFQVGALSAFVAYLVHSITDFNLHIPGHALIFAFFFGIAANPVAANPKPAAPPLALRFFQLALPALGIWILADGLSKFPGDYFTEKTRVAVREHRFEDAERLGQRALQYERRNPFLFYHLGEANRARGTLLPLRMLKERYFKQSVEHYHEALRLYPYEETYWIRLGQAYDGLGDFRSAHTAYLNALRLDPQLYVLYNYYAAHLVAAGREDEATRVLQERAVQRREIMSSPGAPSSLPADPNTAP